MKIGLGNLLIHDFLAILETNDFTHYSSDVKKQNELKAVWEDLKEEYEIRSKDKLKNKKLSISAKIHSLSCKYKSISAMCDVLSYSYDKEAIEVLKEYYLNIDKHNYLKSIDKIELESKSINIEIAKLKRDLPKDQEPSNSNQSIEAVVLAYSAFVGVNLKPNKTTVAEFLALKELFESKITELEKNKDVR